MRELINIKGQAVKHGDRAMINILIDTLPTHTKLELPVYVYRAPKPGPVILLTAGLHGDEINGIETIRRLIVDKSIKLLRGSVIAIPIVNIYSFLQQVRDLPDGKDLNRSFPGSKKGSLAQRLANVLTTEIIPEIDFGIDFHTGAACRPNYPQVRCADEIPENKEIAKAFGAPFVLNSNFIDKSFRKSAYKLGKNIIVYEGGMAQVFDEVSIQEAFDGVLRVLKHYKMIDNAPKAHATKWLSESTWYRAKNAGLFHSRVKLGDKINIGDTIGDITDPFGEKILKIKATDTGYIVGMNVKSVVNAGDALFHVGIH